MIDTPAKFPFQGSKQNWPGSHGTGGGSGGFEKITAMTAMAWAIARQFAIQLFLRAKIIFSPSIGVSFTNRFTRIDAKGGRLVPGITIVDLSRFRSHQKFYNASG